MTAAYQQVQLNKEVVKNQKVALRKLWRKQRAEIPLLRRKNAESAALNALLPLLENHPYVLSYHSFKDEFCTQPLNHLLANEGRLLLPKVDIYFYSRSKYTYSIAHNKISFFRYLR